MKHLRRVATTIVVAVLSAGVVSVSATAASAEDGASQTKPSTYVVSARRDTGWN